MCLQQRNSFGMTTPLLDITDLEFLLVSYAQKRGIITMTYRL